METTLDLNGDWELVERPLGDGVEAADAVRAAPATCAAHVPGDVTDDLVRAGGLPEPLVGVNFRTCAPRVTGAAWWYRKRFVVPKDAPDAMAQLCLDGLDVHADIWLNDAYLGHHASAFLQFARDVRQHLRRDAENVLLVRLTTGAERVRGRTDFPLLSAVPTEASRGYPDRGYAQRIFLRKPAYTWGWDWSPHLPTCGITGECSLRLTDATAIHDLFLRAELSGRDALVHATVEVERHTLTSTAWGRIVLKLTDEQGAVHEVEAREVLLRSGITHVPLQLTIRSPRLWWPNGAGAQHRYRAEVRLETGQGAVDCRSIRWGLRTVALDCKPGLFRFIINGTPLFIQGANWIPCDHLYGRTTPARLERLVEEAAAAHFNCLRIWGGGRFELDAFYEACDQRGILLWHDFMSACAPLPADDPAFAELFCHEAEHQVRRLHNRACLLLWCGNNEVGGCYEWFRDKFEQHKDPAWSLYFERLPRLVQALAPHIPYWPTSPYGGDKSVSDTRVGDDHHWVVMRPDERFWSDPEYWDRPEVSIFNSEYGYGGPCSRTTTQAYLGTDAADLFGDVGREHTNTFYNIPRVNFSIRTHYRDTENLSLDEYILYGGLCQGLNLGYSLESMRANQHTWGAMFWMYNDAWGENGWTIIDYYLRRKVSYYAVRRCLSPRRLVLRRGGQAFGGTDDQVVLVAINDGPRPLRQEVRFGYLSYDGHQDERQRVAITAPPRWHGIVAACAVPDAGRLAHGTIVAAPSGRAALEAAAWRHGTYRAAPPPPAVVRVARVRSIRDAVEVTVRTDRYAHAVHLNVGDNARPSDQFFDLLPGEARTVRVPRGDVPANWRPEVNWVNREPAALPPAPRSDLAGDRT
jgi:beta-mannosidase